MGDGAKIWRERGVAPRPGGNGDGAKRRGQGHVGKPDGEGGVRATSNQTRLQLLTPPPKKKVDYGP